MQPQVSAILRKLKENDNRLPLDSLAKMYGLHVGEPKFKQLLYTFKSRARKQMLYVEDDHLVLDEKITDMTAEDLTECTEDMNREINKVVSNTRDFRLLVIVLVAIVSFVLGALIARSYLQCDVFLDEEVLRNIKCHQCERLE